MQVQERDSGYDISQTYLNLGDITSLDKPSCVWFFSGRPDIFWFIMLAVTNYILGSLDMLIHVGCVEIRAWI